VVCVKATMSILIMVVVAFSTSIALLVKALHLAKVFPSLHNGIWFSHDRRRITALSV